MYIQITFIHIPQDIKDMLIANLEAIAEGFEEDNTDLKAIFLQENYNHNLVTSLAASYGLTFKTDEIAPQNWNALWESNFEPVLVEDFVGIRASFHDPIDNVAHEIIITPKMSFGTGHHATTYLVMKQMQKIDFVNKSVFDFGTGTGVLAILAKKLGASVIVASDIDEWSIQNARENFECNHATAIHLVHTDSSQMQQQFDIILANINRNILLENIATLASQLYTNGLLILSGILAEDILAITQCCGNNGFISADQSEKSNWICLTFKKL